MSLDASDYVYQWNPQIMQEIMTSGAEPYHTVILAIVIMTLCGLSLWASPFIAYKVASGQVYESVSSTLSGWMGAIVGAGIELYSSSLASSITRQAEEKQAQGRYQSKVTRATEGFKRDNLQARASKLIGITGAQGSLTTTLAGIEGGRVQQIRGFEAEKQFGLKGVEAQTDLEKSNIWTRKDLSVADLQALQAREGKNIEIDRHNAQLELWGRKINFVGPKTIEVVATDPVMSFRLCPFGRKASAQVLSWPTPFCRRDTIIGISTAQEIGADLFGGCQVNRRQYQGEARTIGPFQLQTIGSRSLRSQRFGAERDLRRRQFEESE